MDADLKAQWLAALRSGQYEQGRYVLRTPSNKYCCLGVLCDIIDPAGWNVDNTIWKNPDNPTDMSSHLVPEGIAMEVLGTESVWGYKAANQNGVLPFKDREGNYLALSGLNDLGCTFSQIADVIEYSF